MTSLRLRSFVHPPAACHFATPLIQALRPESPHDHDFIELFWIESGEGWHWINKSRRRLAPGALVFIRAQDRHAFSAASPASALRMTNLAFAAPCWRALQKRYTLRDVFDPQSAAPLELRLSELQLASAQSLAGELRMGRTDAAARDRFLLNLAHLIEGEAELATPGAGPPPWMKKLVAGLANPLLNHAPLTTDHLAQQAGCTAEHVSRTFRRWLNKTPTEVLNEAKLARAAVRLAATSDGILEIALHCGFGNLSHFYRLFHDRYHMTPRRYRVAQQRIAWAH